MNLGHPQQSDLPRYRRPSNEEADAQVQLARVTDVLAEMYELLENYAPMWYTERHHETALSALRLVKKVKKAKD